MPDPRGRSALSLTMKTIGKFFKQSQTIFVDQAGMRCSVMTLEVIDEQYFEARFG